MNRPQAPTSKPTLLLLLLILLVTSLGAKSEAAALRIVYGNDNRGELAAGGG